MRGDTPRGLVGRATTAVWEVENRTHTTVNIPRPLGSRSFDDPWKIRNAKASKAQVEIIFFSIPTPAASARSYSSGTVAESWSAMPVESKTVTCSSD